MRRKLSSAAAILGLSLIIPILSFGQDKVPNQHPPKTSMALLTYAHQLAAKQHKAVFVIFIQHDCKWCKPFEDLLKKAPFKKMFEDNYVMVPMDVLEGPDGIRLYENQGGRDYLNSVGGEGMGVPFCVWTDEKGKLLASSKTKNGQNIGYPALKRQIDYFMDNIKLTAPKWSASDQKTLRDYLTANPPKM